MLVTYFIQFNIRTIQEMRSSVIDQMEFYNIIKEFM